MIRDRVPCAYVPLPKMVPTKPYDVSLSDPVRTDTKWGEVNDGLRTFNVKRVWVFSDRTVNVAFPASMNCFMLTGATFAGAAGSRLSSVSRKKGVMRGSVAFGFFGDGTICL